MLLSSHCVCSMCDVYYLPVCGVYFVSVSYYPLISVIMCNVYYLPVCGVYLVCLYVWLSPHLCDYVYYLLVCAVYLVCLYLAILSSL